MKSNASSNSNNTNNIRNTCNIADALSPRVVFLCGLKNCGKTTIAKEVSSLSNCIWFDSDEEILTNNPQYETCRALYKERGEKIFREEELKAVISIIEKIGKVEKVGKIEKLEELKRPNENSSESPNENSNGNPIGSPIEQQNETPNKQKSKNPTFLVSLGGGACDTKEILKLANEHGKLVYLYETEHVLFDRMSKLGMPAYLENLGNFENSENLGNLGNLENTSKNKPKTKSKNQNESAPNTKTKIENTHKSNQEQSTNSDKENTLAKKNFHEIYIRRNEIYSCFARYVIQLQECTKEEVINKILDLLGFVTK